MSQRLSSMFVRPDEDHQGFSSETMSIRLLNRAAALAVVRRARQS